MSSWFSWFRKKKGKNKEVPKVNPERGVESIDAKEGLEKQINIIDKNISKLEKKIEELEPLTEEAMERDNRKETLRLIKKKKIKLI